MPDEVSLDSERGVLRFLQIRRETKVFYNKIAAAYDLLAGHSEGPVREAGMTLLAAAPGEHLLEIGLATGHISAEFADRVGPTGKVCGMDISANVMVVQLSCAPLPAVRCGTLLDPVV